jgi:hypothetical protein
MFSWPEQKKEGYTYHVCGGLGCIMALMGLVCGGDTMMDQLEWGGFYPCWGWILFFKRP